jgi:hypothetical protein
MHYSTGIFSASMAAIRRAEIHGLVGIVLRNDLELMERAMSDLANQLNAATAALSNQAATIAKLQAQIASEATLPPAPFATADAADVTALGALNAEVVSVTPIPAAAVAPPAAG